MNSKITLKIIALVATFTFGLALSNFGIFPKNDPQAQEKIYKFLLKDKNLLREMSNKMQVSPEKERIWIIKEFYQMREKQNLSGLPDDFRFAWEKKILNDIEWANFILHLRNFNGEGVIQTEAQKEIIEEKIAESRRIDSEMIAVSEGYGLEFDALGWLVEK